MAAFYTASELAALVVIDLDGANPISSAQVTSEILKKQTRFTAYCEDRGYSAEDVETTTHNLYELGRDYVFNSVGSWLLGAGTRWDPKHQETRRDMREQAAEILASIVKNPDSEAGADAHGHGDTNPNRVSTPLSRVTAPTPKTLVGRVRRDRQI